MLIDGIHVPLTAPFDREGRVALRKLAQNVGRYSLGPAAGLVALGPGGEAEMLTDAEAADVLRVVGESAAPHKVLVAGIAKDSVHAGLTLAEVAAKSGFDAVMVGVPHIWRFLDKKEVRVFLDAFVDASPLPVMIWTGPSTQTTEALVEMVGAMAGHSNVIGMYDAGLNLERLRAVGAATKDVKREVTVTPVFAPVTGRMLRAGGGDAGLVTLGGGMVVAVKPAIKTRTKAVGFQIMGGARCSELLPLLQEGAAGAMGLLAACAPQGCYEVYAAFKDGDSALSAEKAERVRAAEDVVLKMGAAGIKYGCDLNGYYGGVPRLPRLPLERERRSAVEAGLRELKN